MKEATIKYILAPIDFSDVSLNALHTACAIAKKHGSSLSIVHVIENTNFLYTAGGGLSAIALLPELLDTANEQLKEIALTVRECDQLNVRTTVLTGHPAEAICQEALRQNVDLVVVGTHGKNNFKELFIGTTAYYVVKSSSVPVLTVPEGTQWVDFRKILFPVRVNSNSFEKYEFTRPIIRKEGSSVLLAGIINRKDAQSHFQVEHTMADIHRQLTNDDVVCGVQFYECKNLARQVLEIADAEKPDLIVISTTNESAIWDLFSGPYSRDVVTHSHFPVLSIRPGHEIVAQMKAVQFIDERLGNPSIAFG